MTETISNVELRHYGPSETLGLRDHILPVYEASHADLISRPWWSGEEFWNRLVETYTKTPDFDLVTGQLDGRVVGYAFGSPSDGAVHQDSVHLVFPELEPAGPVYLFREFAVHTDVHRRGIGTLIHDELLSHRPEKAALLLVRQDNVPAQAAYARWGWLKAGTKKPFDDVPEFDALVLNLSDLRKKRRQ